MAYENNAPVDGRELGWDESFECEPSEWKPLPEGDYPFLVESIKRDRYNPKPGAKLPACNVVVVHLRIFGDREITIDHRLYMHTSQMNKLAWFLISIGQGKATDKVFRPRWNDAPGSEGMCHIIIETYKRRDGSEGTANRVSRFLPPPEGATPAAAGSAALQQAQSVRQPAANNWNRSNDQQQIGGYPQPGHWSGRGF